MVVLNTDHLTLLERSQSAGKNLSDFRRVPKFKVADWTLPGAC
jgi:hypothetical protein